eukprot:6742150-Prymnesium_polylepis.1
MYVCGAGGSWKDTGRTLVPFTTGEPCNCEVPEAEFWSAVRAKYYLRALFCQHDPTVRRGGRPPLSR